MNEDAPASKLLAIGGALRSVRDGNWDDMTLDEAAEAVRFADEAKKVADTVLLVAKREKTPQICRVSPAQPRLRHASTFLGYRLRVLGGPHAAKVMP